MDTIKLITLNVAGLNNTNKRKHIAKQITDLKPDLVFIQETY